MAHNRFLAVAKTGRKELHHYLLGIAIVLFSWQIIGILPYLLLTLLSPDQADLNPKLATFSILLAFGIGLLSLWVTLRHIHHRPIVSLINPNLSYEWKHFWKITAVWLILQLVFFGLAPLRGVQIELNTTLSQFLINLLLLTTMIPIQASFEEIFVRGYLLQGLSLIFRRPIFPLLLTSLIFALLHVSQSGSGLFWSEMVFFFIFGLVCGALTLINEGLEVALGIHIAQNWFVLLFFSTEITVLPIEGVFKLTNSGNDNQVTILLGAGAFLVGGIIMFWLKLRHKAHKLRELWQIHQH